MDMKTIYHPLKNPQQYRTHLELQQQYIKGSGIVLTARLVGLGGKGIAEFETTGRNKSVVIHPSKRKSSGQEVVTFIQVQEEFQAKGGAVWELVKGFLAEVNATLDESAKSIIRD